MLFRSVHIVNEQVDVAATPEIGDQIMIAQHDRTR
jgi:hypothetical protein